VWSVEGEAGETEVLTENMPQCHLSSINPTRSDPGTNLGRHSGKPATRLTKTGMSLFYHATQYCLLCITKMKQ
jgi:hypothetical protein